MKYVYVQREKDRREKKENIIKTFTSTLIYNLTVYFHLVCDFIFAVFFYQAPVGLNVRF